MQTWFDARPLQFKANDTVIIGQEVFLNIYFICDNVIID